MVDMGVSLLTTTLSGTLIKFMLPVLITLFSSALDVLVAQGEMLPPEYTQQFH